MKKFGFFLFAVLGLIACGDDNNDPAPEQHVTCAISSPTEGAMIDIAEKMTIKGEATVDIGQISNVTLKIGDKQISEVTSVPFSYEYTFEASQAVGALKIELTVKEYDILCLLAANKGRVLTYEQIYDKVWGEISAGNEKDTVGFHIRNLRKKLCDTNSHFSIDSVREIGYRFNSQ